MSDMGKMLIGMGILLIIVGGILHFGGKFLPWGKLPGDISITGEHGSFYFPVVTCIVISIVLSFIANLFNR
ncbi:Protein of unknown function [Selenomonas sp. GACV-9]|uniref:DUF2905 domain-containing protein n=1 Tax=Selenomonas sp. GACV-9 TaxID=3158782 RepID=UPI0008F2E5EF|nr:Protein of unknown function [Selenomonas ruminantium]